MKLLPYARLMRLPNVFSAMADIFLCIFISFSYMHVENYPYFACAMLLLCCSVCLYISGMVWNDIFDAEIDAKERSFRPIPSGQIARPHAVRLAVGTMTLGLILAFFADDQFTTFSRYNFYNIVSFPIAFVLSSAIISYNAVLKHTIAGPFCMALCRFLNILLGFSFIQHIWMSNEFRIQIALTTATYILGITIFAKQEATTSNRFVLILAALIILAAPLYAGYYAYPKYESFEETPAMFLLGGFLIGMAIPLVRAIRTPSPANVQAAVKRCILGLIVFDAILATIFVGWAGLLIALLLIPALILGKWVYST